ncbi:MAG: helix-turn-helix domain-containing protein [Eubacterium sp.]|nr:helix-turn-helix domain-containing protein [Eubacterium sp.]
MNYMIRDLRDSTGMTQKEFANLFHIPVSTLRKWEQGEASPAPYIIELIAKALPAYDSDLQQIEGENNEIYYYDQTRKLVSDPIGNRIMITEDLKGVKKQNLSLYLHDLFDSFYQIQARFNRDCEYDKKEDIIWIR